MQAGDFCYGNAVQITVCGPAYPSSPTMDMLLLPPSVATHNSFLGENDPVSPRRNLPLRKDSSLLEGWGIFF